MAATTSGVSPNPTLVELGALKNRYDFAIKDFQQASDKAYEICYKTLQGNAPMSMCDDAISESTLAKNKCDQLSTQFGIKMEQYILAGKDLKLLAKTLYDTPEEQSSFLHYTYEALKDPKC